MEEPKFSVWIEFDEATTIKLSEIEGIKRHEGKTYVHTHAKFYDIGISYADAVAKIKGQ